MDGEGHRSDSCQQVITINPVHDYCIGFPADEALQCGEDPGEASIEINTAGCDLLAVSLQDERFDVPDSDGACYKLFRTYRVINWCQFELGIDPDTPLFDNHIDAAPLVISRDEDENGKPGNEDVFVTFQGGLKNGLLTGTTTIAEKCYPTDEYYRTVNYTGGFYQYTQVLKVFDNHAPVILATAPAVSAPSYLSCADTVSHTFLISDACSLTEDVVQHINWLPDPQLALSASLTLFDARSTMSNALAPEQQFQLEMEVDSAGLQLMTRGLFPVGLHHLEVVVEDGCGNSRAERFAFEVADTKAPSPVCYGELSVELAPADLDGDNRYESGKTTVWVSDFIAGTAIDCSLPLTYSIHRARDIDEGRLQPSPSVQSLELTCNDPEILFVYVYAWDAAGNFDRCESIVIINDFLDLCRESGEARVGIAGKITTEDGLPTNHVHIKLSGNQVSNTTADADGFYLFNELDQYADYTVHPYSNHAPRDGVTTYDLILISKHILGTGFISSPYRRIAADINNSQSITALDIIHLRKFILNLVDHFPNNQSWRFVDASYQFPDPERPWLEIFPEVINYNDLTYQVENADFVAIKIGDVNNDAGTRALSSTVPDGRRTAPVAQQVPIQFFRSHPNPFREQTTVTFQLLQDETVTFEIFNAEGKLLTGMEKYYAKGLHQITTAPPGTAAGTYFYSLKTNGGRMIKRVVRIK